MSDAIDQTQYSPTNLKALCDIVMSHFFAGISYESQEEIVNLGYTDVVGTALKANIIAIKSTPYSDRNNLYYTGSVTLNWLHYAKNVNGFTEADFLNDCHCQKVFNSLKNSGVIIRPKRFARNWISSYAQEYKNWNVRSTEYFARKKLRRYNHFLSFISFHSFFKGEFFSKYLNTG